MYCSYDFIMFKMLYYISTNSVLHLREFRVTDLWTVSRVGPSLLGALSRFSCGAPQTNMLSPDVSSFLICSRCETYLQSLALFVISLYHTAVVMTVMTLGVANLPKVLDFEVQSVM